MAFNNARDVDASRGVFNDIAGNQYIIQIFNDERRTISLQSIAQHLQSDSFPTSYPPRTEPSGPTPVTEGVQGRKPDVGELEQILRQLHANPSGQHIQNAAGVPQSGLQSRDATAVPSSNLPEVTLSSDGTIPNSFSTTADSIASTSSLRGAPPSDLEYYSRNAVRPSGQYSYNSRDFTAESSRDGVISNSYSASAFQGASPLRPPERGHPYLVSSYTAPVSSPPHTPISPHYYGYNPVPSLPGPLQTPYTPHAVYRENSTVVDQGIYMNQTSDSQNLKSLPVTHPQSNKPPSEVLRLGHERGVWCVAVSPDGKLIASGSDEFIRLWDAESGKRLQDPFFDADGEVRGLAFSTNGSRLVAEVVHSWSWEIRVFEVASGEVEKSFKQPEDIRSPVFSPDGRYIAFGCKTHKKRLCIISSSSGQNVIDPPQGHTYIVQSVAYSRDGKRLVSASYDKTVRVWDPSTGKLVAGPFEGHSGGVNSVAFSFDGTKIVSGSDDRTVRVWDASTGECLFVCEGHTSQVSSVSFSPDGVTLASASQDKTIRIWDATAGQPKVSPLIWHTDTVTSIAFLPDGERIVSASHDKTVCIGYWNQR